MRLWREPGARGPALARLVPALAALLAVLAPACRTTVNPATGRRQVLLLSEEDERKLDEKESERIIGLAGLVQNPELAAYVERLGERLASYSPRRDIDYRFHVVEIESPNAFALPGGSIFVTRGLVLLSNSEAELAGVLAHEIAHVAARHHAERHAHMSTLGLATLWSNMIGGRREEEPGRTETGGPGGVFAVYAYSRNQEREADRLGQELLARAGIDPRGLSRFFRTLENATRLGLGFSHPQSYFDTHPTTPERIADSATLAQSQSWTPSFAIAPTRADYLSRLEGVAAERPAAEGVFVASHFLHPALGFSLRFPPGWELTNLSTQVVGVSPHRDALVQLQLQGEGTDPAAAATEFAREEKLHLVDGVAVRIGSLPAYRARALVPTDFGALNAELTWIAFRGRIYRLAAGQEPGRFGHYEGIFRSFARSFGPITDTERAMVSELRLRVAVAHAGESLEQLSRRSGNEWDPSFTAVVNGFVMGTPLEDGQLVKVAVREPYRPAPEGPGDAEPSAARSSRRATSIANGGTASSSEPPATLAALVRISSPE